MADLNFVEGEGISIQTSPNPSDTGILDIEIASTVEATGGTDISGKVDRDAVEAATARLVQVKLAAGDTQPAFRIGGDGKHEWGAGGAAAPDTNLFRGGVSVVKTAGQLHAGTYMAAFAGTSNETALIPAGVAFAGGDTSLARFAAGYIKTPGGLLAGQEMWVNHNQPADKAILIGHTGTVNYAVIVLGGDTRIYRGPAGVLGATMGALGDKDIVYGAPDSGGAGYRMLRITN